MTTAAYDLLERQLIQRRIEATLPEDEEERLLERLQQLRDQLPPDDRAFRDQQIRERLKQRFVIGFEAQLPSEPFPWALGLPIYRLPQLGLVYVSGKLIHAEDHFLPYKHPSEQPGPSRVFFNDAVEAADDNEWCALIAGPSFLDLMPPIFSTEFTTKDFPLKLAILPEEAALRRINRWVDYLERKRLRYFWESVHLGNMESLVPMLRNVPRDKWGAELQTRIVKLIQKLDERIDVVGPSVSPTGTTGTNKKHKSSVSWSLF